MNEMSNQHRPLQPMPRSKDKVIRPKPSEQNVKSAIKMVIEKRLSIRKAAEEFHVSKSLIGRYVKLNKEKENVEVVYHPLNAVKRVFSDEEEEQLVEYCLKASKIHYGICKDDFLKLAFEYAVILKKKLIQVLGTQIKNWKDIL
ncbi:unnamed protein product [Parnassius apollo]|uniref:(apollo) hypothetical protein n=1 Tax=Parnassius apollo TaxID=110799 RepID=A0A8S3XTY9_PARAO|nr:unnamed protein product [Parnassius apollo]